MVDKKDVILEEIIEEVKPTDKETKFVAKTDYEVDLFSDDKVVGQIRFKAASNSIEFSGVGRRTSAELEIFVTKTIAVEGRSFNPVDSPKEWVQNLCNVSPLALYKTWSASEARKI